MLRISNGVMTMTSEERREVAERLRGPFDVCGCGRYTYLSGTLYGMQVCTKDELTLRDGMRRLADLLDPTCEVMEVPDNDEFMIRVVSGFMCKRCGHEAIVERNCDGSAEPPKYCPHCGARVVSDDG